jgi:hypothetical protein
MQLTYVADSNVVEGLVIEIDSGGYEIHDGDEKRVII